MEKISLAAMGLYSGVYIKTRIINVPKQAPIDNRNIQAMKRSQYNEETTKKLNDSRSQNHYLQTNSNTRTLQFHCYETINNKNHENGYIFNHLNSEINGKNYKQDGRYYNANTEIISTDPYHK